jgi:membrane fusion protein, multidrug efflux system
MNAQTSKIEPEAKATLVAAVEPETPPQKPKKRRRLLLVSLPLVLLAAGASNWLIGGRYVTTDNAYIHQPLIPVSSDVSGRITSVSGSENQQVEAGAVLFTLDQEPYKIALARSEAVLASARLAVEQKRADYETAVAQLDAAQGISQVQSRELERQEQMEARGVSSRAAVDQVRISAENARNSVSIAERQLAAAAAALGGDPAIETDAMPSVREAQAARDAAARDLAMTQVVAPVSGILSHLDSLNVGQFLAAGSDAAFVVNDRDTWIEANFKETQLADLSVGQAVTIEVDAYPDATLTGTIESFGSATGSSFSLIPAQNATGNWVKVVQRVPVRIRIEGAPDIVLRDGMSAHVSVDTGRDRLAELL